VLGCLVRIVDCVLRHEREAARDRQGGRVLRESSGSSIYCTKGKKQGHHEVHQEVGKVARSTGRRGNLRRRRNWPAMLAGGSDSGDGFRRFEAKSMREKRGGEGGGGGG
jgi:hypothetical protein